MQRCGTGDAEGSEDAARAHGVQRQGDGVRQHVQLLRVGLCERGCRYDSVPACASLSVRIFDESQLTCDDIVAAVFSFSVVQSKQAAIVPEKWTLQVALARC